MEEKKNLKPHSIMYVEGPKTGERDGSYGCCFF